MKNIEEYVRTIPDFPEKGIMFRDITSVIQDPDGLALSIDKIDEAIGDIDYDVVVGPESRGFIFGVPVAYALGAGFVPVRKKGKLPGETLEISYGLEYGSDILQIHKDSIKKGQRVAIVDDLLATGGTTEAAIKLIEKAEAEIVSLDFVIELTGLNGREKFKDIDCSFIPKIIEFVWRFG